MTIATGVQKKVAYKKESTFGVDPGTGSAQYLRRVTNDIDLDKDTYKSNQINPSYQVRDFRHGMRKIGGGNKDELSCTTYKDWFAAILRKAFAAGVTTGALTTLSSTAPVGVTPGFITRSSGSFLTDGFKVGDAITMTGWATTMVGANSRTYFILALTATVMTIIELTGIANTTLVTKAAGDSVTIVASCSKSYMPATGQTNDSFTIENFYSDITQSERFNGCRISALDLELPSTGMATADWTVMGQNAVSASSQYYVTPTAATTTGILAAVNGRLAYSGGLSGLVTSVSLKVDAGMTTGSVVGSNQTPDVFVGGFGLSGQLGLYFQDGVARDDFWLENTPTLIVAMASDNNAVPSSYMLINMPKIKLGSFKRDDGMKGLIGTASFTALENVAGGAGLATEGTTMSVQDSTF